MKNYMTEAGKNLYNSSEALKPFYQITVGTYELSKQDFENNKEEINKFLADHQDWTIEPLNIDENLNYFILYCPADWEG